MAEQDYAAVLRWTMKWSQKKVTLTIKWSDHKFVLTQQVRGKNLNKRVWRWHILMHLWVSFPFPLDTKTWLSRYVQLEALKVTAHMEMITPPINPFKELVSNKHHYQGQMCILWGFVEVFLRETAWIWPGLEQRMQESTQFYLFLFIFSLWSITFRLIISQIDNLKCTKKKLEPKFLIIFRIIHTVLKTNSIPNQNHLCHILREVKLINESK